MSAEGAGSDSAGLHERIAELEREKRELEARLDATNKRIERVMEIVLGDIEPAEIDDLVSGSVWGRLDELEGRIDGNADAARNALGIAAAASNGDSNNERKIDVAKSLSRNELVRTAAVDRVGEGGTGLSTSQIQDMAKPEVAIYYQTIKDAWQQLEAAWDAITITTRDGQKRLTLDKQGISRELVGAVEHDLERDDLAKKLISREQSRGVGK